MSKVRRLDVMLSSTSRDLPEHRKQAEDAASRAGFYVVKMENLVAMHNEDAISVSMAMVEEAEVYVGIFGMRYGYRPKDDRNPNDLSITEMEYRRAKELGMPILIFMMSEDHAGPIKEGMTAREQKKAMEAFYESDDIGEEKLEVFKKELGTNHIVGFFDNESDLRMKVLQALSTPSLKQAARDYAEKRAAEVEAGTAEIKASAPKVTIPYPPNLYAFPPYSGQSATFVGRREELRYLDQWADASGENPMLVVEAIGGMGKSALTWKWIQDRAVPFDGMFWYSFYEGGADMTDCVRHALAYVTRRDPTTLFTMKLPQMLAELVRALQNGRYLLVLDGLERVLVAYHRWNAAQMQDDQIEEGSDYRACTDPRDNDVLRQLAGCDPSRILITSRLLPRALSEGDDTLAGVQHTKLKGLSPEDARRLWQDHGITWGDEGHLDSFINQFGRHSLLLKLMIDVIKKNRRSRGDFDRWYAIHGESFDVYKSVKAKRHHILEFAYAGLSDEAKSLLSQMAALGSAVDIDTLSLFNPYSNMPDVVPRPIYPEDYPEGSVQRMMQELMQKFISKQYEEYEAYIEEKTRYEKSDHYTWAIREFDALLQDLEERGLIWWDAVNLEYDLHPVVRGYAFSQLEEDDRPTTYTRIYYFFQEQESLYVPAEFNQLRDLQHLITMYHALIGSGEFDKAGQLFTQRVAVNLIQRGLGVNKGYELLLPLFGDGLGQMPTIDDEKIRLSLANFMSLALGYMGDNEKSFNLRTKIMKETLNAFEGMPKRMFSNMIYIINYASALKNDNKLIQTVRCLRLVRELNQLEYVKNKVEQETMTQFIEGFILADLAGISATIQDWQTYLSRYNLLLEVLNSIEEPIEVSSLDTTPFLWHAIYLTVNDGDPNEVEQIFQKIETLNAERNNLSTLRSILSTRADLALFQGNYQDAIQHSSQAVRMANEQGVLDRLASQVLAQAHALGGDLDEALRLVEDGIDDHGRAAAIVYLKSGDHEAATESALKFYEYAWAQGEPYVRRYSLNLAREILAELGVDEPQLPVWDESRYEPFEVEQDLLDLIERIKNMPEEEEEEKPSNPFAPSSDDDLFGDFDDDEDYFDDDDFSFDDDDDKGTKPSNPFATSDDDDDKS